MKTVAGTAEYQEEINKSRFIARVSRATSAEEAQTFFDRVRESEATHNAWAYKIGPQCRCSDDGEVGGTAGKPILSVIEKQGLDQVAVMVTRYYGGIRLGTGGLVRAYGGSAGRCLLAAGSSEIRAMKTARLPVGFKAVGRILNLLKTLGVECLAQTPIATGMEFQLRFPADQETPLRAALQDCLNTLPPLDMID